MFHPDDDTIMINDENDEESVTLQDIPSAEDETENNRTSGRRPSGQESAGDDDKKKLGFKMTYEGFSIWGWVLCLFVERKGGPGKKASGVEGNAQALMQDWIASTQQQNEDDL